MRKWVIGDIHGAHLALEQCLERSGFDPANDLLICLGDVCDGWPGVKPAMDMLMELPNVVMTMGNHDYWALEWGKSGKHHSQWLWQGGQQTVESFKGKMGYEYVQWLEKSLPYYQEENKLFVHAGIHPEKPLSNQDVDVFLWDRTLFRKAIDGFLDGNLPDHFSSFEEIYIGHSPTHGYGFKHPVQLAEVWLMDTGAGWDGVLSIMDIDTKEYFTSDPVNTLYPKGSGRM